MAPFRGQIREGTKLRRTQVPLVGAAVSLEVVSRGGLEVFFISVTCVYEVVHPFCLFSAFYLYKLMIFFHYIL